jgi:hypothetical protein
MENTLPCLGIVPGASRDFVSPKPNRGLMWTLGYVNRWMILRGHLRVRHFDLPRADRARLRMAVNENTAAFIAPNHPEFGTDWILDKELSTLVAPRMASWAAHGIVRSAPAFWRRNNLIANNGGEAATEYSVAWALDGHGVLLHPEGMVHWTADRIHRLFGGVAELACEAARRADGTRVYIAPVVWKLRYLHDVSDALHAEMRLIERVLGLASGDGLRIANRFQALQNNLLERQMRRFECETSVSDLFGRQEVFRAHLVADLLTRHDVEPSESIDQAIHRLSRTVAEKRKHERSPGLEVDAKKVAEAERLGGFCRDIYSTAMLSQEQIGESLKRIRASMLRDGLANTLHNFLPTPYGDRVAHVRVPEPIAIDTMRASASTECERTTYVCSLIEATRMRMQQRLDAINVEIGEQVAEFSHPNPFV